MYSLFTVTEQTSWGHFLPSNCHGPTKGKIATSLGLLLCKPKPRNQPYPEHITCKRGILKIESELTVKIKWLPWMEDQRKIWSLLCSLKVVFFTHGLLPSPIQPPCFLPPSWKLKETKGLVIYSICKNQQME